MIVSFWDPATEDLFHGLWTTRTRRFPVGIVRAARRKLDVLNAAHDLRDLGVLRGNRLEPLRGALSGLHSIRVNEQWRLVFRWTREGPAAVRLNDHH